MLRITSAVGAAVLAWAAQPVPPPAASFQPAAIRDETFVSAALARSMKYRVLLPADYSSSTVRYHTLYLLHGLTGNDRDWSTKTELARLAQGLPFVVVMPDGENSWYTNAANGGARFEDYIAADLVTEVETKYRVIRSRYGRQIAGLSMGGYGAIKLALKHPDVYAAAGSFSGAFPVAADVAYANQFPDDRAEILRIFGPAGSPTRVDNDVYGLAEGATASRVPPLYIDCGTGDSLLAANRRLVEILQRRGFRYEYHETPGTHAWDYWNRRLAVFLRWAGDHAQRMP
ncbi:MAG TPA: alpha/beta hydrolase family protein [Vicinamibacterales bacterium]|nr:alpha/beta hydrolase family protein [Vicinamibacterales bacterium]